MIIKLTSTFPSSRPPVGGTAGCCLAARLTESSLVSVLLIERGPVADTWANSVPMISANVYAKDALARQSKTEPLPECNDRELTILRGEALGGGSRVNAMIYTRGVAGDYNHWGDLGHPTWDYKHLLPYFNKSEHSLSQPPSEFRGSSGMVLLRSASSDILTEPFTGLWENQTFPTLPWRSLT